VTLTTPIGNSLSSKVKHLIIIHLYTKFGDYRFSRSGDMITGVEIEQEAQLPQTDRETRYVGKFVLFHELWEL